MKDNIKTQNLHINGTAAIREGELSITKSEGTGQAATIAPGNNVEIMIDSRIIQSEEQINDEQKIVITPATIEPIRELGLKVSKDKMTAELHIDYRAGKRYLLDDTGFMEQLMINCTRAEPIEQPFTLQEVLDFLNERRIAYGIDRKAIRQALKTLEPTVVATGKPWIPGKDGWIENLVAAADKGLDLPDEGHGIIGNRAIKIVNKQQKLAKRHSSTAGEAGTDVYGEAVQPPKPKEAVLVAGVGTELEEDGYLVKAIIDGRFERNKNRFCVYPVYNVDGDADAKDGYIKFKGDIMINGNVMDGMKVEAGGMIEIKGLAANSTLTARENIIVHHNLVGCKVQAGGMSLLTQNIKETLIELEQKLKEICYAAKSLKESLQAAHKKRPGGVILRLLIEQKFSSIPKLLEDTLRMLEDAEYGYCEKNIEKKYLGSTIENIKEWRLKLVGVGVLQIKKITELDDLLKTTTSNIQNLFAELSDEACKEAYFSCPYIQNSEVSANGDVIVNGKGCYNSTISAGGNVEITGSPGVIRGGSVTAKGHFRAVEVGSIAEIATFIQVDKKAFIKAQMVHPGVILKCGHRIEKMTEKQNSLYFTV